jgi:hypothetical protein
MGVPGARVYASSVKMGGGEMILPPSVVSPLSRKKTRPATSDYPNTREPLKSVLIITMPRFYGNRGKWGRPLTLFLSLAQVV